MNQERDKFLTEALGECWHPEFITEDDNGRCPKCDIGLAVPLGTYCVPAHNFISFSTWKGFGKLWEWAQNQEWWDDTHLWINYSEEGHDICAGYFIQENLVHPDRFANALYKFLKETL